MVGGLRVAKVIDFLNDVKTWVFFWHGEFFLDGKTKELLANLYSFQSLGN